VPILLKISQLISGLTDAEDTSKQLAGGTRGTMADDTKNGWLMLAT
jgi:hypothetical protein